MNSKIVGPDYYRDFCRITAQCPHLKGICYVKELWDHPDWPISATRLYCLYNYADPPCLETDSEVLNYGTGEYDCYAIPELPIRVCDYTTLQQLKKEVAKLYSQLQTARQNNNLARAEECKAILDQCHDYLKHSISSQGKLYYLSNLEHSHSLLIMRSVNRLYKTLSSRAPHLATYLPQHVVIGVKCRWSEREICKKHKEPES